MVSEANIEEDDDDGFAAIIYDQQYINENPEDVSELTTSDFKELNEIAIRLSDDRILPK